MEPTVNHHNFNPEGKGGPVKGEVRNPSGLNGMVKGSYKPYNHRLQHWTTELDTYQLLALYKDKLRFGMLHPLDAACITHLIDCIYGKGRGEALERALNRLEGGAKGTQPTTAVQVNVTQENNVTVNDSPARKLFESRINGVAARLREAGNTLGPNGSGAEPVSERLEILGTAETVTS